MTKEILTTLQEELARRNLLVEEKQAALDAAKKDRDDFVTEISSTLGIARKPGQSNDSVKRRQARVLELYKQGKTGPDIAIELGLQTKTVHNDLRKLRNDKQVVDGIDPKITPQATRVLELFREGEALPDIAEALKITTLEVKSHIDNLRSRGLLPPASGDATLYPTPGKKTPSAEVKDDDRDDSEEVDDESTEKPATKEQLQAEVSRQQLGIKSKVVVLQTATVRKHSHKVKVDRMGDGQTILDSSGHAHRCFRFTLSEAHKHTHDLIVVG
jgi:DNA-binding NarL/FixJ family response regulator